MRLWNFVLVFVMIMTTTSAYARPGTATEIAEIQERMVAFVDAIEVGDYPSLIGYSLPPRLLDLMIKSAGAEQIEFTQLMSSSMEASMADIEFENFEYDVTAVNLENSGEIVYGYFPSSFEMTIDGATQSISNPILALYDEKWYLVRVDERQHLLLQMAYPELAALEMPYTVQN